MGLGMEISGVRFSPGAVYNIGFGRLRSTSQGLDPHRTARVFSTVLSVVGLWCVLYLQVSPKNHQGLP